MKEFIQDIHYYIDNNRVVFTERYHLERGSCCGKSCRHCPYYPKHITGTTRTETDNFTEEQN